MPKPQPARLLIVDDEDAQREALCNTLGEHGYSTSGFNSAAAALSALGDGSFDLLLTDLMMPEINGISLLDRALKLDPNLVGIVMTGQGTIDSAVQAMKAGALDYILKPFRLSAILPVLSRALAVRQLRLDNLALERRVRQRTAELEAANQELEAFSYSVSHDLRAPLRHVKAYIQLVKTEDHASLSADSHQFLQNASAAAARMESLISDLLDFARMGRGVLSRSSFSTADLIAEVLRETKLDAESSEIRWEIETLAEVSADRAMLKQVWTNLLSNAVKYSRNRHPAVIRIGCRTHAEEFEFYVRDNGIGFDTQYAGKLFGVFQRLHSPEEFEGTGIGLASVRRIINRHGGRTWAEGKPDAGATFYFTVPRSREE